MLFASSARAFHSSEFEITFAMCTEYALFCFCLNLRENQLGMVPGYTKVPGYLVCVSDILISDDNADAYVVEYVDLLDLRHFTH